jgi:hypothetical protein
MGSFLAGGNTTITLGKLAARRFLFQFASKLELGYLALREVCNDPLNNVSV